MSDKRIEKACEHEWVDIPDPGGYVGRECKFCRANMDNVRSFDVDEAFAKNAIGSRLAWWANP